MESKYKNYIPDLKTSLKVALGTAGVVGAAGIIKKITSNSQAKEDQEVDLKELQEVALKKPQGIKTLSLDKVDKIGSNNENYLLGTAGVVGAAGIIKKITSNSQAQEVKVQEDQTDNIIKIATINLLHKDTINFFKIKGGEKQKIDNLWKNNLKNFDECDVILLQEADENRINLLDRNKFTITSNKYNNNKFLLAVAINKNKFIFINSYIKSFSNNNIRALKVECKDKINNIEYAFTSVHFESLAHMEPKPEMNDYLETFFNFANNRKGPSVIGGDFNISKQKLKMEKINDWEELTNGVGFTSHVNSTNPTAVQLDYIFSKNLEKINEITKIPKDEKDLITWRQEGNFFSDHAIVIVDAKRK